MAAAEWTKGNAREESAEISQPSVIVGTRPIRSERAPPGTPTAAFAPLKNAQSSGSCHTGTPQSRARNSRNASVELARVKSEKIAIAVQSGRERGPESSMDAPRGGDSLFLSGIRVTSRR